MPHIALDANVLLRDPWLRGQDMHALADFVRKSSWQVLLLEVVETEVKEGVRRRFDEWTNKIATELKNAEKAGLIDLPSWNAKQRLDQNLQLWQKNFDKVWSRRVADRVPLNKDVVSEAVWRTAKRLPPCKDKKGGEGTRDAIIWLELLEASKPNGPKDHVAFVSENTKDFAGPDGLSLHEWLASDVEGYAANIAYYRSLKDFLKEHAEPVQHVSRQWLQRRLNLEPVEDAVRRRLANESYRGFKVAESGHRNRYVPVGKPDIKSVSSNLVDFYVWSFENGRTGLQLDLRVYVDAVMVCERLSVPANLPFHDRMEHDFDEPRQRTLECFTEVDVEVSATVEGDSIKLLEFEYPDAREHPHARALNWST